jgi:hypothetical protein
MILIGDTAYEKFHLNVHVFLHELRFEYGINRRYTFKIIYIHLFIILEDPRFEHNPRIIYTNMYSFEIEV